MSIIFCSCQETIERQFVVSNNYEDTLTILSKGTKHYFINGRIHNNAIPLDGYVLNDNSVNENFIGLIKWNKGKAKIYYIYGDFEESKSEEISLSRISVKEFEKIKDSSEYKYFYY